MQADTLERLPNTVTKCHSMIRTLQDAAGANAAARILELEAERDELKDRLKSSEDENEELQARVKELEENEHPDAICAIDRFLDECERTGPQRFDVPQSDRVNRAIVNLHDAVGRQP